MGTRHGKNVCVPLTCPHSVGIVASNSYIVMVNPIVATFKYGYCVMRGVTIHTIGLVVILHVEERVKIDVAMEVDVRPAQGSG